VRKGIFGSERAQKAWPGFNQLRMAILPAAVLLIVMHARGSVQNAGWSAHSTRQSRPVENCSVAEHQKPCEIPRARRAVMKVPEPAPLFLLGTGLLSLAALIRSRVVR